MWLKESNRPKHLKYAIPTAFIGTILFAAGVAFGMEFKDKQYGGKFDWLDIAATMIGGFIGQILQILFILVIIYLIQHMEALNIIMGIVGNATVLGLIYYFLVKRKK